MEKSLNVRLGKQREIIKLISNLRGETIMVREHQPANLFELSSEDIQVAYSSSSIKGSPLLSYRNGKLNCQFSGEEILSVMREISQLLTVTLEHTVDSRVVTFTLILPIVTVMPASAGTYIEVCGIATITHMTIAGVAVGSEKTYSQVNLKGTAQVVISK
jgi:hypothetical protein